ncbi:MAG: hypothetical protein WD529_02840 [Balneolaceae bacterium]
MEYEIHLNNMSPFKVNFNRLSGISILAISIGLISCSHISEQIQVSDFDESIHVDYSLIYYIHSDSDYLYHTPDGIQIRDNSKVLETAFDVAESARSGEVFIYYQRPEKRLLGLFPQNNSRLYIYKKGKLINEVNFRHTDRKETFLTTEAQLIHQYRARNLNDDHQLFFFYFGHEIPLINGKGYHHSLPGIDVNTISFAKGIQNFLVTDQERFELVVLSTCSNGTPTMALHLSPFTNVMLASPQNLHLSHIKSDSLTLLETEYDITTHQLGHSIAEYTFERLEETVHTSITLALYDLYEVQSYIHTLDSLTSVDIESDQNLQLNENVDCAEIYPLDSEYYRQGVESWYRSARFGRQSGLVVHSGWGCKPVLE